MWALLWHWSEGKVTRDVFMDTDSWTLVNVYFRPNANDGEEGKGYWPVGRKGTDTDRQDPGQPMGMKEMFFKVWRDRGMDEKAIEERYQAWRL